MFSPKEYGPMKVHFRVLPLNSDSFAYTLYLPLVLLPRIAQNHEEPVP